MARSNTHRDVEFSVKNSAGVNQTFSTWMEATAVAVTLAAGGRNAAIDVLIYTEAGAYWYGGHDAVDKFLVDPERSVFDRFLIKARYIGPIA